MQKPNVKINWQFEDAFCILFDFDNGDLKYCYRPEDGQFDIDPDSRFYKHAEWLLNEDENLSDYMQDQASDIMADITRLIRDKYQKGYVDTTALLEQTEYEKWTS